MDGVAKVLISGGVFQVVIGTHVKYVFEEVEAIVGPRREGAGENAGKPGTKRNPAEVVIDFVSGTFQPIIPALSGAGMVKALLALLVVFNLIDSSSQTYYILNFFADGVFYFLPILLTVLFMSYVEKFAERFSPNAVKAVLRPLLTWASQPRWL